MISLCADMKGAEEYLETLDKLTIEENYLLEQIAMWLKPPFSGNGCLKEISSIRRPSQCHVLWLLKAEYKSCLGAVTDIHTLKLCDLAQGEAQGLQVYCKHTLAVYHRSNKKSWMTQLLLQDALLNCCVSKMERYCLKDNIPLKILLFLDSAPGHPPLIGNLHLQIEVVFLLQI